MMNSCENIFEVYRNADFMNRLHIYLQYPDLRENFLEIDQADTGKDPFASVPRPHIGRSGLHKFIDQQLDRYIGLTSFVDTYTEHK